MRIKMEQKGDGIVEKKSQEREGKGGRRMTGREDGREQVMRKGDRWRNR